MCATACMWRPELVLSYPVGLRDWTQPILNEYFQHPKENAWWPRRPCLSLVCSVFAIPLCPLELDPPYLRMVVIPTKSYNGCSHWVLQNWRTKASGQDSSWDEGVLASLQAILTVPTFVGLTGPLAIALFQVTISLWSSVFYKQTFPEKGTPVLRTLQSWLTNQNSVIVGSWSVTNPDPLSWSIFSPLDRHSWLTSVT